MCVCVCVSGVSRVGGEVKVNNPGALHLRSNNPNGGHRKSSVQATTFGTTSMMSVCVKWFILKQ